MAVNYFPHRDCPWYDQNLQKQHQLFIGGISLLSCLHHWHREELGISMEILELQKIEEQCIFIVIAECVIVDEKNHVLQKYLEFDFS